MRHIRILRFIAIQQNRVMSTNRNPLVLLISLHAALAIAAVAGSSASIGTARESFGKAAGHDSIDQVIGEVRRGDEGVALDRLRAMSREGDPAASELLGVLLLAGPPSLRVDNISGPRNCDALAWLDLASGEGSRVATAYLAMMEPAERRFARAHCFELGE